MSIHENSSGSVVLGGAWGDGEDISKGRLLRHLQ